MPKPSAQCARKLFLWERATPVPRPCKAGEEKTQDDELLDLGEREGDFDGLASPPLVKIQRLQLIRPRLYFNLIFTTWSAPVTPPPPSLRSSCCFVSLILQWYYHQSPAAYRLRRRIEIQNFWSALVWRDSGRHAVPSAPRRPRTRISCSNSRRSLKSCGPWLRRPCFFIGGGCAGREDVRRYHSQLEWG